MEALLEIMEKYFVLIIEYLILIIECIGVGVLVVTIISGIIEAIRHKDHMRLNLVEGIALAIEFKMGGELLRTVIVREWSEILILGAIILLRAGMTFLLQWEISLEKKNEKEAAELAEHEHAEESAEK